MNKARTLQFLFFLLILSVFLTPLAFSQDNFAVSGSFNVSINTPMASTPQDKLQALESTRFHFITLKQFHSGLFTVDRKKTKIPEKEAYILNAALNAFLTKVGRETLLLESLRQNRPVRVRFSIPEKTDDYQVIDNPDKPLAYQLEPVFRSVPATIEIKPLLDQPIAFKITLRKGNDNYVYDIDWSGQIICITCLNNPALAS